MLEALQIQGFRLFDEFNVDNLARVNLIVGKNNVGKSSLLEAVHLLVNQLSPKALAELLEARGEVATGDELLDSRGYELTHLFFGHQLSPGDSLQLTADGPQPLSLKLTYMIGPEPPEMGNGHTRRPRRSYIQFSYKGPVDAEIEIDVAGKLVDRRQLLMYEEPAASPLASSYLTTTGLSYDAPEQFNILTPITDTVNVSGVEALLRLFRLQLKASEKRAIGIILDANHDIEKRWRQVTQIIEQSVVTENLPPLPQLGGLIIPAAAPHLPKVGVWLMPNNEALGMLEDFVAYLIPDNDPLSPHVDTALAGIESAQLNKYKQRSKAFIHTWLAWQEPPACQWVQPLPSEVYRPILPWLKHLLAG